MEQEAPGTPQLLAGQKDSIKPRLEKDRAGSLELQHPAQAKDNMISEARSQESLLDSAKNQPDEMA